MPTPPADWTLSDLFIRALSPRRQSTMAPVTFAGSSVPSWHRAARAAEPANPAAAASTSGAEARAPPTEAPLTVKPGPPARLTVTVEVNARLTVEAATEVVHGTLEGEPTVPAPGPELPAEFATNTPALAALSSASSCGPNTAAVSLPRDR